MVDCRPVRRGLSDLRRRHGAYQEAVDAARPISGATRQRFVWRPDALGSICFLVASALAWFEVCHGWVAWRSREWSWWITLLAAYVNPVTATRTLARLGTFVGAACFFVGDLLLLPERTEGISPAATTSDARPGAD